MLAVERYQLGEQEALGLLFRVFEMIAVDENTCIDSKSIIIWVKKYQLWYFTENQSKIAKKLIIIMNELNNNTIN